MLKVKQVAICLSNSPDYDWQEHFLHLRRAGLLLEVTVGDCHVDLRLPSGLVGKLRVLLQLKEYRTDLSIVEINGAPSCSIETARELIVSIRPLWAGVKVDDNGGPLCNTLSHVSSVPHLTEHSYWDRRYETFFSGRLKSLAVENGCYVEECPDGIWVEVKSCSSCDGMTQARWLERCLTEKAVWDGGGEVSEAVGMALVGQTSLESGFKALDQWRLAHESFAMQNEQAILAWGRRVVNDLGTKRRKSDACSIIARENGVVAWFWVEASRDEIEFSTRDRVLRGRIGWAAILHGFKKLGKGKNAQITCEIEVFNSMAKPVRHDNARVLYVNSR